jgi:hypothetical protein
MDNNDTKGCGNGELIQKDGRHSRLVLKTGMPRNIVVLIGNDIKEKDAEIILGVIKKCSETITSHQLSQMRSGKDASMNAVEELIGKEYAKAIGYNDPSTRRILREYWVKHMCSCD